MNIRQVPAHPQNWTNPSTPRIVDRIVIHVMDGTLAGTDAWFANPASQVSAHYGIGANGEIHQYVPESGIAWHAGRWDVNERSIGIEHEGRQEANAPDWIPTPAQFAASVALAADICERHNIEPSEGTILRHSAINPSHARCPGSGWPMNRFVAEVAARLRPQNVPVRLFDPVSNEQVGVGTFISGTDKVYVKSLVQDDGR